MNHYELSHGTKEDKISNRKAFEFQIYLNFNQRISARSQMTKNPIRTISI